MYKNKKGFGDVFSSLIMFIAVAGVSVGFVIAIKNYAIDTQESIDYQNDVSSNLLRTSIEITNIYYNSSQNKTYIYLKNIGKTQLETKFFDLFIDDSFQTGFDVVEAGNASKNMSFIFPSQTALFIHENALSSGTHSIKLVSGYGGVGDTDYFNN